MCQCDSCSNVRKSRPCVGAQRVRHSSHGDVRLHLSRRTRGIPQEQGTVLCGTRTENARGRQEAHRHPVWSPRGSIPQRKIINGDPDAYIGASGSCALNVRLFHGQLVSRPAVIAPFREEIVNFSHGTKRIRMHKCGDARPLQLLWTRCFHVDSQHQFVLVHKDLRRKVTNPYCCRGRVRSTL